MNMAACSNKCGAVEHIHGSACIWRDVEAAKEVGFPGCGNSSSWSRTKHHHQQLQDSFHEKQWKLLLSFLLSVKFRSKKNIQLAVLPSFLGLTGEKLSVKLASSTKAKFFLSCLSLHHPVFGREYSVHGGFSQQSSKSDNLSYNQFPLVSMKLVERKFPDGLDPILRLLNAEIWLISLEMTLLCLRSPLCNSHLEISKMWSLFPTTILQVAVVANCLTTCWLQLLSTFSWEKDRCEKKCEYFVNEYNGRTLGGYQLFITISCHFKYFQNQRPFVPISYTDSKPEHA